MTAARNFTDADLDALAERLAERVAAKLRAQRRQAPVVAAVPPEPIVTEVDAARARAALEKLGMLSPRGKRRARR